MIVKDWARKMSKKARKDVAFLGASYCGPQPPHPETYALSLKDDAAYDTKHMNNAILRIEMSRDEAARITATLTHLLADHPEPNPLAWIRNLPEVSLRFQVHTVERIDQIDARIRLRTKEIADLARERRNLVKDSERQAQGLWTVVDIERAKKT